VTKYIPTAHCPSWLSNALFYKTLNGAGAGDLIISMIGCCPERVKHVIIFVRPRPKHEALRTHNLRTERDTRVPISRVGWLTAYFLTL
jgi:hypothetical protein